MRGDFATLVTGWLFIAAASMLWLGWVLLPRKIGTFFQVDDFAAVHGRLHFWIWMYRIHLFGMITSVMALVALGALIGEREARILVWPGAAVASSGLVVGAIAAAFYYHFGAWGALDMNGQSTGTIQGFVDSLRVSTEYVTCLVRFGRVFTGLGLLVLALGLLKGNLLPFWIGGGAVVIGLAAMALTMAFPNNLALYLPVFHLKALWLLATGLVLLRSGLRPAA